MAQITEVVKIRRKVLSEIARLAFSNELDKHNIVDVLDNVVHESGPRYRCCVHKERAVVKDRVKFVMAQPLDIGVTEAAKNALNGDIAEMPILNIMPEACDQCPIDTFFVTNACRNCIAHNCIASCPKQAITVVQNQAYIDKTACIECGLCKKSCMYGAIVEIIRPCERACDIGAIKADKERKAVINYDKCVQCGGCKMACPFGAITEQSFTVQLIQKIKAGKRVYAILAPAFIGQFGMKVKPSQVVGALKQIGFFDVQEVSFGADIVTLEEAKEFAETVPNKHSFMTTSCCPAFVDMVNKHLPELKDHVSTTVSPMVATGKVIKAADPEAVVVFVGPCLAKKVEAKQYPESIDFVFTFEEIESLFVGANIIISEVPETDFTTTASRDGNAFAKAGGVVQAVIDAAAKMNPDLIIKPHRAEGLQNCKIALQQIKNGKIDANFFEGMACAGGCVGGPGILTDVRISNKMVDTFAASSAMAAAPDNQKAIDESQKILHWHTK
ncbi:MAG: 4Fe-4S dicluster domain-containing protein [Sporomusaceae bacterium]|nr:4Fe-4S dicluster domain-containing protein [Sporomusaceae bacterium]